MRAAVVRPGPWPPGPHRLERPHDPASQHPIGARLATAFACLIVLLLITGGIGLHSLQATQARLDSMYADRVVPLKQLKQIADATP